MTSPKIEIFEQFAELARVLGQGNRLELLEHAAQGERSVERLAQLTGLSLANASQHLQVLRRAGFVRSRRDGKRVLYRLGDGPVVELLGALRRYAEHSRAEVRGIVSAYFTKLDSLEPVFARSAAGAIRRRQRGAAGRAPRGRVSRWAICRARSTFPSPTSNDASPSCPRTRRSSPTAAGPYCVLSFEAVAALRAKGYDSQATGGRLSGVEGSSLPLGPESDDRRPSVRSS